MRGRERAAEVIQARTNQRLGDLVDLIELGAWPIEAAATVGWEVDTAIKRLGRAIDEATDPDDLERYRHARVLISEAMDRYLFATGETAGKPDPKPTPESRARATARRARARAAARNAS